MIKVPITYEDFDGKTVTEEHYFHLSKSEILDMAAADDGEDVGAKLERIGKSGDGGLILKTFKEIIASAYGQRVDGSGSQFYKDPDLTKRFMGSLAFDQLLVDLVTNEVSAAAFMNGLLPKDLEKFAARTAGQTVQDVPLPGIVSASDEIQRKYGLKNPYNKNSELLPWASREPNQTELTSMTHAQLLEVMDRKNKGWKPPVSS